MTVETLPARALREPQQGRSKASFERMLVTAETLMAERGSDDFTLNEVSKRGKVSIGSIYCRFDSKDDLIHAVQLRVLDRMDTQMMDGLERAEMQASSLDDAISRLVETVAESLSGFGDRMRPLMARASNDPVVAAVGKASYARTAAAVQRTILAHGGAIRHPDPARAADAAFRILYASLARYLGFGLSSEAAHEGDWTLLKQDLADMLWAYLASGPRSSSKS